jgi:hypothetical protein
VGTASGQETSNPTPWSGMFVFVRSIVINKSHGIGKSLGELQMISTGIIKLGSRGVKNENASNSDTRDSRFDNAVTTEFSSVHGDAIKSGKMSYVDPRSGYTVFTELFHLKRGTCCGARCRHCPFNHKNVKTAEL